MKSSSLALPGCGGGWVRGPLLTLLLMLGTTLFLPSDAAGIRCHRRTMDPGDCRPGTTCCYRQFAPRLDDHAFTCGTDPQCSSSDVGKCVNDNRPNYITCTCTTPECNHEEGWKEDPVYKAWKDKNGGGSPPGSPPGSPGASPGGPGGSPGGPEGSPGGSGSKASVSAPSALLIVMALGSLPHLVTALIF